MGDQKLGFALGDVSEGGGLVLLAFYLKDGQDWRLLQIVSVLVWFLRAGFEWGVGVLEGSFFLAMWFAFCSGFWRDWVRVGG